MTSSSAATSQQNTITLKGSVDIVMDFFKYGINNILFQRCVYPSESFSRVQQYDLTLFLSNDEQINNYLNNIFSELRGWLESGKVMKLVLAIANSQTNEVLEMWNFNIELEDTNSDSLRRTTAAKESPSSAAKTTNGEKALSSSPLPAPATHAVAVGLKGQSQAASVSGKKDMKEIKKEIKAIMTQITACVSFLPALDDCLCSFNILVHTKKDTDIPNSWDEHGPCLISNAENLKLHSFSTSVHRVHTSVTYSTKDA